MSNKIIKSVISTSTSDTIQMDLISSMIQTFVQFDNDKEELTRFEVKFKILFDYFENFVLPEMKKLNLKFRENVRKFNKMADILPSILSLKLELSELKDVKSLTELNFSIIQTNLLKLFLINIRKCLGTLFDVQNIFISADKLQSQELHDLLAQDPNLNVFVICSGKIDENLKNIFTSKLTFIVSDDIQCQELTQQLTELGLSPTKVVVNYGWNDLTVDSQKLLLKMKINFQNNSEFSFLDILKDEFHPEDEEVVRNFNDIVDDQLLRLMIEGSGIEVNVVQDHEKEVENWFQEQKFMKKELEKYKNSKTADECVTKFSNESLSEEELLKDCKDDRFVIISDKPGSGKSWTIKKFSKFLKTANPTKWVTSVDLNQFTEQFKDQMAARCEFDFPSFFADAVLKGRTKFEVEVFKKLYDLGKVFIFMDGLDELTPSCTDFLLKQIKTFESNEGSQLWMATCESLEVDLHKVLEHNAKFKFEEFLEDVCTDLIAFNWIFNDSKEGSDCKLDVDAGKDIKSLQQLDSYRKLSKDLLDKSSTLRFGPIGMPQLCKLIAEITRDDKSASTELTELKIYKEFTQNLQKQWQNQQDSGTETQNLNFWMFHELMAMKSLFPGYSEFIDQKLEDVKTLKDENSDFLHSTFRDFFVAEFILRILRQEEVPNWFLQFLLKVLTTRRYQCIRMFLNQGFGDLSELKFSDKTVKGITANIDEFTNISFVFGENLENLQKFLVMCLNKRRYKVVKSILVSNLDAIFGSFKRSEIQINPQILLDLLVKFLNSKCLENLIKEKKLFFTIIESCEDVEHFERFANAVKAKLGALFVVQNFKGHRRAKHPSIFFTFCWSKNVDGSKVQKFIKILKGFLNIRKIMELLKSEKKWNFRNVFNDCINRGDPEILKALWTEVENFYKSNESHQKFKELVMHGAALYQSVLQTVAYSTDIKLHEAFWDLAISTFGQEELINFIKHKETSFTDYFWGSLVSSLDSPEIIEFTYKKLQAIFSIEQFHDIMGNKCGSGSNLLLKSTEIAKNIKTLTSVWNLMINFCKSDEKFLELVCSLNDTGCNILIAAIRSNKHETFEFIINKLKAIATRENIKVLLTVVNNSSQNILFNIYESKLFIAAWDVICDFLEPSDILEILQTCDCSGNNFIINNFYYYSYTNINICQDVWEGVKKFINSHEVVPDEVDENIEKCEKFIKNLDKYRHTNNTVEDIMKMKWVKLKTLRLMDSPETLRLQIAKSNLFSCAYDFYILANCENLEIHEISWEFILKKYENRQDLVKLMTKRSVHGSIFIHSIMSNKNIQVINFILKIIADNFREAQIKELLTIKCPKGVTLLSVAARDSKNLQIVKTLWELHQKCFSNFDFVVNKSDNQSNLIMCAAESTAEIFQFLLSELDKFYGSEKLVELVSQRGLDQKTVLQVCVEQHDIELLKVVWNEVKSVLGGTLKSIVKLLDVVVTDGREYYDWHDDIMNIVKVAATCDKIELHEALWELLWATYEEEDELKSLILWKNDKKVEVKDDDDESSSSDEAEDDKSSRSSEERVYNKRMLEDAETCDPNEYTNISSILYNLNRIFQPACPAVIKITMQNLDRILTKNEIGKILKCCIYDCFLENRSDRIEKQQVLWDIYRQYLSVPYLKNNAHKFFSKALCNAATISEEIFKFTWNEAVKEAEDILIPALESDCPIICTSIAHKDKDLLKIVWKQVEEFYKVQNLPESFKEHVMVRKYHESIFEAASRVDDLELHEVLWELLLACFVDREELKNMLVRKTDIDRCLMADCFRNWNSNVVEFMTKTLKDNFTNSQLQELIKADSNLLFNCLYVDDKKFEIFQIWWEFFKNIFQTSEQFVEFIEANDNFQTIFGYGCEETLELVFNDLKSFMTHDQIRQNMLKKIKENEDFRNILHIAVRRGSKCGTAYKLSWQYVHEYLEEQEIVKFLTEIDKDKRTFFFFVVLCYTKEFVDIAWTEIKKVLSHKEQIKFLKGKHPIYGNLYQCASTYVYDRDAMILKIEQTFREYRIRINK
ncbi:hypothetical protein ACKWTF_015368 [Chironomus riparius]